MDIQEENNLIQEAFEVEADEVGFCLDQKWGDYENPYENSDTALAFNLFKKGWQAAAAQAVPEWISVKDKLPGFNQSVLSCDGFETCVAEYLESCKNEYGVFFEEGFWINGAASIFENVTHWMPLPEAIEAQEQSHECQNP